MKQIKIYDYYSFGYNYNILLSGHSDKTNSECLEDLKRYSEFINELDLRVTKSSIKLVKVLPELAKFEKIAKAKKTKDEKVDPELWKCIILKLEKVDSTLDAELDTKIAYLLDEKRFTNEILLDKINQLFSKDTFVTLPTIAKLTLKKVENV